ncbi:type I restriction-modification system subunit M N-terminal domain-containing protein [Cyanobium sp. BA20m-p-22]|uniref:type I restriction-modification system subunit M N-terminal domain-containing protein n=1 Tax=Cyanobium sp. BA20m-p-22 TaxID=2823704 RepID=UPI0020CB7AE9|nr:type I restriction-modification system subunit M N-terminal domain-containing protein [Cyanobium sp. BA20m-p-22]
MTFTPPEADEEDTGEDPGGLDDLLASLRSDEEPAPKRGRGRAKNEAPAKDFKTVLWASADKLRAQMDAAEYKHLVLGLIFLKYISDTFVEHQQKVLQTVGDPASDYYLGDAPEDHQAALEDRDYYTQENVFWVPSDARWESLRARAKQPDIGQLIDRALVAIENENQILRGKLDKRFGAAQQKPTSSAFPGKT